MSKLPVLGENAKQCYIERQEAYEEIAQRLGKCNSQNVKEWQKETEALEIALDKKYPVGSKIKYPKTMKQMRELIARFGTAIAFSMDRDDDGKQKLTAFIADNNKPPQ